MMAISGKFEATKKIWCATCGKHQTLIARSLEWTGNLRTDLICSTPNCNIKLNGKGTGGNTSTHPQVDLFSFPCGDRVVLEDYDCTEKEADHFCSVFRDVLGKIPKAATEALMTHWQSGCGSPHVWLLSDPQEWKGSGVAASSHDGLSLYLFSDIIGKMPDEHLETTIAHELGHSLFLAGKEKYHCPPKPSPFASPVNDPLLKKRPEWLVWQLMDSWGFDQRKTQIWIECNLIHDANGTSINPQPRDHDVVKKECLANRSKVEKELNGIIFPTDFEKYLQTS